MRSRVLLGAFGGALALSVLVVPIASATPAAPTDLGVGGSSCTSGQPVWAGVPDADGTSLSAFFPDPDGGTVTAQAQWWPAADPSQVHTVTGGGAAAGRIDWVDIARGDLADNSTYAVQVRGLDADGPGPWTAVCTFRTDFVAPTSSPGVTATGYQFVAPGQPSTPMGGTGEPGTVTLDAHGDTDITGFRWGDSFADNYAATDHPGGTATVTIVPELAGTQQFTAASADEAGNTGPAVTFDYAVTDNRAQVSCAPNPVYLGSTAQCTFRPAPGSTDVTGYQYWSGGESGTTTVSAGPDGTATAAVTPDIAGQVHADALLSTGHPTEPTYDVLTVDPGAPVLTAPSLVPAGSVVQVAVRAVLPGSTTVTYQWDATPAVTVPLTFGTAALTFPTPPPGGHTITAHTTTPSGLASGPATAYLTVDPA